MLQRGRRENPYKENSFDGVSLNPLEVIFVKVKGYLLELEWTTPTLADAVDRWMHHQVDPPPLGAVRRRAACELRQLRRWVGGLAERPAGGQCSMIESRNGGLKVFATSLASSRLHCPRISGASRWSRADLVWNAPTGVRGWM